MALDKREYMGYGGSNPCMNDEPQYFSRDDNGSTFGQPMCKLI